MGKKIILSIFGLISLIYLINPTAGILELLPDNMPFVGNLDEATATALLLACLRSFGFDITNLFSKKIEDKKN